MQGVGDLANGQMMHTYKNTRMRKSNLPHTPNVTGDGALFTAVSTLLGVTLSFACALDRNSSRIILFAPWGIPFSFS